MTIDESIKWQEAFKDTYKVFTEKAIEATDIAIGALENQIPKKPIITTNMMTKEKGICCPNCETWYNRFYENKKYCMECGQRLKWSDEE